MKTLAVLLVLAGVSFTCGGYHIGYNVGHHAGFTAGIVEGIKSERDRPKNPCSTCGGSGCLYTDGPNILRNHPVKGSSDSQKVPCPDCHGTGKSPFEAPDDLTAMPVLKCLRKYSKVILKHALNGTQPTDDDWLGFAGAVQAANSVEGIDGK